MACRHRAITDLKRLGAVAVGAHPLMACRPRAITDASRRGRAARRRRPCRDERGVYAPFIAIIAAALLLLGGIAYDGPRLTIARQDAVHAAREAARVAAATIAAGGTVRDARDAAAGRIERSRLIYGQPVAVGAVECTGSTVEVTVVSNYVFRSVLGLARDRQPIEAVGAAEAYLVLPDESRNPIGYLGTCPL